MSTYGNRWRLRVTLIRPNTFLAGTDPWLTPDPLDPALSAIEDWAHHIESLDRSQRDAEVECLRVLLAERQSMTSEESP